VVTVSAGEDTQEPQLMLLNDDHDQREEKNNEKEEEEGDKAEGEDDKDYTPSSNAKKDETFHDTDEIKTFGDEALIPTGRLRDLLYRINITTPLELRIMRRVQGNCGDHQWTQCVQPIQGTSLQDHLPGCSS
jgi:hypothetical protein